MIRSHVRTGGWLDGNKQLAQAGNWHRQPTRNSDVLDELGGCALPKDLESKKQTKQFNQPIPHSGVHPGPRFVLPSFPGSLNIVTRKSSANHPGKALEFTHELLPVESPHEAPPFFF